MPTALLPLLLLLFVGSGCSALIYEIVWFQLLQLSIGSSAVSMGVVLGTFMGGMCLGSLLFPRLVSQSRHPLRVYAVLEFAIGAMGVGLLFLAPMAGQMYVASADGSASLWMRGLVCVACLLPPTMLMGATLPAIARWMETTPSGVARMGFFYGANIAGAVFGCLLAGFYLLRVHDVAIATAVAASINAIVALVGWTVASRAPYRRRERARAPAVVRASQGSSRWLVYVAIGLSGAAALGAEVVWTRLLALLLGATVYTFSIILAVFLVGLGIGSSIGSALANARVRPRLALGACQLSLVAAIAWSAYVLTRSLPYWPIDVSLGASPWVQFQLDLMRCVWAILPAACLWGASFPLALAAAARQGSDPARLAGGVYAANTLGAILGAAGFSLFGMSHLGAQHAQQALIVVSAIGAALMLLSARPASGETDTDEPRLDLLMPALALLGIVGIGGAAVWTVTPTPQGLIGYGRYLATYEPESLPEFLYSGEGMNASIAVSEFGSGYRNFHVSGKVVASSEPQDMRLQRMLCHIPALIHESPKSVLIVGCGAGVTAGSFVIHPSIEKIVICEIEPLIPAAAGRFFAYENHAVMADPRLTIVYDDARHYIATTKEKFDIITSDPIHPWVKGAAALYSREYFQLCKQRLNPGGVVTQWVPLYESNEAAVKSQIATFIEAFPDGSIWSNESDGQGYDIVLLGAPEPTPIDVDRLQLRLEESDHKLVREALADHHLGSAIALLATYAGQGKDLKPWLEDAQLNHDRNMRLQYLAGMGVNAFEGDAIYRAFLQYRRYPQNLFVAHRVEEVVLRQLLKPPSGDEPGDN